MHINTGGRGEESPSLCYTAVGLVVPPRAFFFTTPLSLLENIHCYKLKKSREKNNGKSSIYASFFISLFTAEQFTFRYKIYR